MSLLMPYTSDFSQMVLAVKKHPEMPNMIILINPYYYNFPKNPSLRGMSLFFIYTLVSLVLDFSQMVLVVRKHL